MQVVIFAGGKGTRTGDLPGPMAPLAGKPILEHQIELARRYGAADIILLTGHLGETIEDYFHHGRAWGVSIRYHRQAAPLGTAGALKEVEDWLADDFLVFHGDTLMDLDLNRLARAHLQRRAAATLVVHPTPQPCLGDLVEADKEGRISALHARPHDPGRFYHNCADAALHVLSRGLLQSIRRGAYADLGKHVFPSALAAGQPLMAYNTPEYITDVDTPDRLHAAEQDVVSGKVARLNRANVRKAIFLDRDGVLNAEADRIVSPHDLQLLPGAAEAVRRINRSEFLAVVVTNQPAVAKGWLTESDLDLIHAKLESALGAEQAYLDRIYYCPHHPKTGFPGEILQYKIPCQCRKPSPGMLLSAAAELNIDLAGSWMIGDRTIDIEAGARAGARTALVRTGHAGADGTSDRKPDRIFDDLDEATRCLLRDGP